MRLETDFTIPLTSPWRLTEIGAGRVRQSSGALRLDLPACASDSYHDAQISDYAGKSDYRWRPPLHMEVKAGVSHQSSTTTPSLRFPASKEGLADGASPPLRLRGGGRLSGVGFFAKCGLRGRAQHLFHTCLSLLQQAFLPQPDGFQPPAIKNLPLRGGGRGVGLSDAPLHGTAGFGFWNHPFVPGERGFRLPQAVWFFFSSPPSDMRLALDVPGPGWKAATIDARRWPLLLLLPTAPLGFVLMRFPALYRRLWPVAQRAIGVSEAMLDSNLLTEPHTYSLDWRADGVTFAVDGVTVHHAPVMMHGPLGFIMWVDNQYAMVTPQGRFSFGLVDVPQPQALVVEYVRIVDRG